MEKEYMQSKCLNSDIINIIQNTLEMWQLASDHDIRTIKVDLDDIIESIKQEHFVNSTDCKIYRGIHCVVHNFIWDALMPLVRAMFTEEDTYLYQKSKKFCKFGKTLDEEDNYLGTISCTSAIVELSMMDVYKSPLEMLNCLCTSYDLIYAELKSALVTVISKHSDRELEIPVVNNEEVIHLVCKVLIKSQMLHFSSNLFYIKLFGEQILKCDQNMRSILNNFEVAMNHIMTLDESTMKSGELEDGITACEMMKILSEEERSDVRYSCNLEFEKRKRLVSLVMTSTAEKNLVPSDQSKVFI